MKNNMTNAEILAHPDTHHFMNINNDALEATLAEIAFPTHLIATAPMGDRFTKIFVLDIEDIA